MKGYGFVWMALVNVFTHRTVNNRVDSYRPSYHDKDLGQAMYENETEPGSQKYGWGKRFSVRAVRVDDPVLRDHRLMNGCTSVQAVQKVLMDARQETYKNLLNEVENKNDPTNEKAAQLAAFETLYTDGNGRLLEPDWEKAVVLIEGHHRHGSACLLHCKVLCDAHTNPKTGKQEPREFFPFVPVELVEFTGGYLELRETQIKGNGSEQIHNPLSDLDRVQAAREMIPMGYTENRFRTLTGVNGGAPARRAYLIAQLDLKFPKLKVFEALKRFQDAMAVPNAKKADVMKSTSVMGVPWEALHINANDPNGNVAVVLRCTGSIDELKAFEARKGSVVSPAEKEVLAAGVPWSDERLQEWWKTRFPCLNGGVLVSAIDKPKRADADYATKLLNNDAGMGEIGRLFGAAVMAESPDARSQDTSVSLLMNVKDVLNQAIEILKSPIAGSFRELVAEVDLAIAAEMPPEELAAAVEDFRVQLDVRRQRAKAEAEAPKVDTESSGETDEGENAAQTETDNEPTDTDKPTHRGRKGSKAK